MESIITSTQLIRIHVLAMISCNRMIIVNVTINKPCKRWSDIIKTFVFNVKRKRSLDKISPRQNFIQLSLSSVKMFSFVNVWCIYQTKYCKRNNFYNQTEKICWISVYLYLCLYICFPSSSLCYIHVQLQSISLSYTLYLIYLPPPPSSSLCYIHIQLQSRINIRNWKLMLLIM